MSHTVKTTIVTTASGEISGYGFCVEAGHNGEPAEIAACITASLDMLRATITASFAPADPPPGYAPAAPPEPVEGQPPADLRRTGVLHTPSAAPPPSTQPPQTPEEAEQRFYARYGAIIGGQDWADVRRYLQEPRRAAPTSVDQWIAAAEAVRDQSRSEASPRTESSPSPARRAHARH